MQLSLRAVSHRYADLSVLEDVDLDVRAGEVVCLVGPSGCGKSTLLRLIGGLERPDQGEVVQIGEPPAGSLNPLTYVFQDFALLPWRTVEGNVSLVLEDHPLSRAERRGVVDEVLERTKLTEFRGALPRELSGGMRQRVGIARAFAVRPAVFLMDEPLSALDAQTRELLLDDLVELWSREPFTCVYVTHNLAEAVRLAHRIVVLSRRPGRVREIVSIDTPLDARAGREAELATEQARLWRLLRDEAAAAEREVRIG